MSDMEPLFDFNLVSDFSALGMCVRLELVGRTAEPLVPVLRDDLLTCTCRLGW